MKFWNLAFAAAFVGAIAFAAPQVHAAKGGKSATHRQDGSHGHKGSKGGKSADHRKDGEHRQDGKKGRKSAEHRKDGAHRNDHAGTNGH
jgi:hypothetical protein